jgi:hypothetical protein|uniref:Uncharacterized protein n=1 Tax=uncultured marine virus TaxID=186617 RepID=A0A0F7L3K9_9VIRU|nr:hypothetical protein [uncultured marine virus]
MIQYEYGAVSSRYILEAENKLTAYATIVLHYRNSPHLVVIYEPEDADTWFSVDGEVSDKLDNIFGGEGSFDDYLEKNMEEIKKCYASIKQIC